MSCMPFLDDEVFNFAVQHDASVHRTTGLSSNVITRIESEVPYATFFKEFLLPNKPCIISSEVYTNSWLSRKEWVTSPGIPNVEFLSQRFGDAMVPVTDCKISESGCQPKTDWAFKDFMVYLSKFDAVVENRLLYLKDWHFVRKFPNYKAYSLPQYFSSDWLNEYCDYMQEDDYKFVYMGSKGTWTPFHADVYRSYSWSANVCGQKRWYIYPPGKEECFRDVNGYFVNSVLSSELLNKRKYPFMDGINSQSDCLEVIQNAGEIIFVPSGWHHEVYNLDHTISINHNWFNGCNIDMVWAALESGLVDVEKEIADCSDADTFQEDCQIVLNANHGLDYKKIFLILKFISSERMRFILENSNFVNFHAVFDLIKAHNILTKLSENMDAKNLQLDFREDIKEHLEIVSRELDSIMSASLS